MTWRVRLAVVWVLLVAGTCIAFRVGGPDRIGDLEPLAILSIAGLKARLVFREFMEIRISPRAWQWTTDAWVVACVAIVSGMHLM